ncbi:MAG: peptidase T [Eubacteriales bacterium]
MTVAERFLNYVAIHTKSDDDSTTVPTTGRQFDLANQLVEELRELGVENAVVDEKCYVYASIPAAEGLEEQTAIGFIAHMDTAPDYSGDKVMPQIIEHYDGMDVKLGDSGRVLSSQKFPHLKRCVGRTLITTDGTTLLGADDKAGIAEIMALVEGIMTEEIPHGKICIGFTPDEEVGRGANHFDVEKFGAELAYTCDGDEEGYVEFDNFNASSATVEVKGFNVHPGTAKNTMVNALLVAMEFNQMLPSAQTPRDTKGYEGFYHLCEMSGEIASATMEYIVRDHSATAFQVKLDTMKHIEDILNQKYGEGTVTLTIEEQYRNMREKIEPHMHLIEVAKEAITMAGITPKEQAIRGGTDGARLSFMGLPCPNLGTGGHAFHGPYEHITVEGMEKAVEILKNIVLLYGKKEN